MTLLALMDGGFSNTFVGFSPVLSIMKAKYLTQVRVGERGRCLNCPTIVVKKRSWQKYCSYICKNRITSRRYEKKNKGNPERKKINNARYKEWRDKQREQGLCIRCNRGNLVLEGYSICVQCLEEIIR